MHSSTARIETPGDHQRGDKYSYFNSHQPSREYATSHPHSMDPPRPLEPRPILSTTLAESHSGTLARPDPVRRPSVSQDSWSHGQSLPGLRDLLSPTSQTPSHPPFSSPWGQSPRLPQHASGPDFSRAPGVQPPQPLHPPSDHPYASQTPRRYDGPGFDFDRRRPSLTPATYPKAQDHYSERRQSIQSQAPSTNYLPSGAPSPYTPGTGTTEDANNRGAPTRHDRSGSVAFSTSGSDVTNKYIGVEKTVEGTFHLYEGGQRIPTHIDGEHVNPQWGLTKAMKPRKRLALACLDCREKKIKCEPGTISCVQCEKAKRPCRRAPQQTQADAVMSAAWPPTPVATAGHVQSRHDSTATQAHLIHPEHPPKRRSESGYSPTSYKKPRSSPPIRTFIPASTYTPDGLPSDALSMHLGAPDRPPGMLALDSDPYKIDRHATMHLLNLFFAHAQHYNMFPRHHFMHWVTTCMDKTQNERIMLYSILAFASYFADNTLAGFGNDCARIASDAVLPRIGRPNLSVTVTRTLLGLYYYAKGSDEICWDHIGSAMAAALSLMYYTEMGCNSDHDAVSDHFVLGFSKDQIVECRRRVFWALFVVERHGANPKCTLKSEDIFLRVPCDEDLYERGRPSEAPLFDNDIVEKSDALLTSTSAVGPTAYLIAVSAIHGDVQDFTSRGLYYGKSTYRDAYERFYAGVNSRVQQWLGQLPPWLVYSEANLDQSIQRGYAGSFIAMHSLHHYLIMTVNRKVRHHLFTPEAVRRNIQAAHVAGNAVLQMMTAIRGARREISGSLDGQPATWAMSVAFAGFPTLLAVDIITAGGKEAKLKPTLEATEDACECLREIGQFWAKAREQWKICERRYYELKNITTGARTNKSGAWIGDRWGMEKALVAHLPGWYDCICGLDNFETYYEALDDLEKQKLNGTATVAT